MKYLSTFSGIEAASVAWEPLGWEPVGFSEIEPFPCQVLKHHYPDVPNYGDITKYKEWPDLDFRLLVGGSPCQSFSIAGLRKGLDDPRGNLMFAYLGVAARYKPEWIVWENVPGVLSSNKGKDFGAFLGGLAELGYGFAYRVLDTQYVRVESHPRAIPQRRRRVFVVGCLGGWQRAAAVLFERESLFGYPPPSRKKREGTAGGVEIGPSGGRLTEVNPTLDTRGQDGPIRNQLAGAVIEPTWWDGGQVSQTLDAVLAKGQTMPEKNRFPAVLEPVAYSIMPMNSGKDYKDRITDVDQPIMAGGPAGGNQGGGFICEKLIPFDTTQITSKSNYSKPKEGDPCHPLAAGAHPPAVAFAQNTRDEVREMDVVGALEAQPGMKQTSYIRNHMKVRRLTPLECERLQGFPDNWTNITLEKGKTSPDGRRYKACGNSMSTNVMRWIGDRINMVDSIK